MNTQYSDIGNGLSTKKYVFRRSNRSGIEKSSAPAPHLTVFSVVSNRLKVKDF